MTDPVDELIELSRACHELTSSYGVNAHRRAAELAADALSEGDRAENDFWNNVEQMLRPRVTLTTQAISQSAHAQDDQSFIDSISILNHS